MYGLALLYGSNFFIEKFCNSKKTSTFTSESTSKVTKFTSESIYCSLLLPLSLSSQFAICAMKVKNRPMVNEVLGGEEALRKKLTQLEKENGQLRNKLGSVSGHQLE